MPRLRGGNFHFAFLRHLQAAECLDPIFPTEVA